MVSVGKKLANYCIVTDCLTVLLHTVDVSVDEAFSTCLKK